LRFRGWLVRISFRPALDHGRSTRRREQRETAWATDLPKPTAEDIAASNEFARRLQKAMEAQKNHGWFYYSPVSMVTG